MASSLDQVGTLTKTVKDAVILLETISGYDANDAMSVDRGDEPKRRIESLGTKDLKGKKLALPKQFMNEGLDDRVRDRFHQTLAMLRDL